jgi:hypothetical protein
MAKRRAESEEHGLVQYEAARHALQAAHSIDEVKTIRYKAEAMRANARQANDVKFQNWAAEIRLRAERRASELLVEMENVSPSPVPAQPVPYTRQRKISRLTGVLSILTLDILPTILRSGRKVKRQLMISSCDS